MPPFVNLSYRCHEGRFRQVGGDAVLLNGGALYCVDGPLGEEQGVLQASFNGLVYDRASEDVLEGGLSGQKQLDLFTLGDLEIHQLGVGRVGRGSRLTLFATQRRVELVDERGLTLSYYEQSSGQWHYGDPKLALSYSKALWIAPPGYFLPHVGPPQAGPRSRLSALAAGHTAVPSIPSRAAG